MWLLNWIAMGFSIRGWTHNSFFISLEVKFFPSFYNVQNVDLHRVKNGNKMYNAHLLGEELYSLRDKIQNKLIYNRCQRQSDVISDDASGKHYYLVEVTFYIVLMVFFSAVLRPSFGVGK